MQEDCGYFYWFHPWKILCNTYHPVLLISLIKQTYLTGFIWKFNWVVYHIFSVSSVSFKGIHRQIDWVIWRCFLIVLYCEYRVDLINKQEKVRRAILGHRNSWHPIPSVKHVSCSTAWTLSGLLFQEAADQILLSSFMCRGASVPLEAAVGHV